MKVPNRRVKGKLCWYCGDEAFGFDHQKPRHKHKGLQNNKVPACYECNAMKGDKDVEGFRQLVQGWAATPQTKGKRVRMVAKLEPHGFRFFAERRLQNLPLCSPDSNDKVTIAESILLKRRKDVRVSRWEPDDLWITEDDVRICT